MSLLMARERYILLETNLQKGFLNPQTEEGLMSLNLKRGTETCLVTESLRWTEEGLDQAKIQATEETLQIVQGMNLLTSIAEDHHLLTSIEEDHHPLTSLAEDPHPLKDTGKNLPAMKEDLQILLVGDTKDGIVR